MMPQLRSGWYDFVKVPGVVRIYWNSQGGMTLLGLTQHFDYSSKKGATTMASIKLIPEEEATGKVKEIFADIMETHGIDFVPNMYKAMAAKPSYLEANWIG